MDVTDAILKRRSIRNWKPDPVEKQKIEKVLEAARRAPSWGNTQPWRFIVVQDRAKIDEIIERMDEKPINLAGKTNLKELAYLYSKCQLQVSTDTGPMHIAAAMGCPVVALFGPTAPWRTGPYGKGHRVIREEMECSPCFKKRCDHLSCMRSITVDWVFDTVEESLNDLRGKE